MMLFNCLSCLSSTMGIFGYIFATFCSHTTAFSTQVQRKINPFNSIYTSTAGTEYPSLPVSHRCISLWKKSRQCVSAGYPLPSHKDHISVTLEWKYCCLGILHLDSSIFLQCFFHALLKRQTVLLSNKLQKQVENIQLLFLWWTLDWETYTFQLWAAPINYTSSPVVILLQMWVFPDTQLSMFLLFPVWQRCQPKKADGDTSPATGPADTPVHRAANRGVTAATFTLMWYNVQLLLQIQPFS